VRWVDGGDMDAYTSIHACPAATKRRNLAPTGWRIRRDKVSRPACCFSAGGLQPGLGAQADHDTRIHRVANYASTWTPAIRAFSPEALCRQARVRHVVDEIVSGRVQRQGDISHLVTKTGESLSAICSSIASGFSAAIDQQALRHPVLPQKDVLFYRQAWRVQIP